MPDLTTTAIATAAEAVDPNSQHNQDIVSRATTPVPGMSYADRLAGAAKAATEIDVKFLDGLEDANNKKHALPDDGTNGEPLANDDKPEPSKPRALTDPPVARSQRSNFRVLESQLKEAQSKLAALEKNGTASDKPSSTTTTANAELLALQKELNEARTELSLLDITKSPEFVQKFDTPRRITVQQAKNISGSNGSEVEAILNMPPGALRDTKLEELYKDLPASTAAIVRAANNKLAELDFYQQIEVEQNRANASARAQQHEAKTAREAALRNATFETLAQEWAQAGVAIDGNTLSAARNYFDGSKLNHRERAAAALQSALVPSLLAEAEERESEIGRLQAQLKRFSGSLPGGGNAVQDTDEPMRPQSPGDRDRDFMAGLHKAIKSDPMHTAFRRTQAF